MGAQLTRHSSKQDLGTPWPFVWACEQKWGPIAWDLAASANNTKAPRYLGKRINSLKQDWTDILRRDIGWLNPEFDPVAPWIDKVCLECEKGARLIVNTRASVGADWFWQMEPLGNVYTLKPRLIYLNQRDKITGRPLKKPKVYPSDLIVTVFNLEPKQPMQRWEWKKESALLLQPETTSKETRK